MNNETDVSSKKAVHVLLTKRDLEILLSLYENIVMTYSQIARRHFENSAMATAVNRLTKLERAGYIRREKIPRMQLGLDQRALGVVYQITKDGIRALARWDSRKELKPQPIRIHPYTLNHDLILCDLRVSLEGKYPGSQIINAKHLSGSIGRHDSPEPDLVLVSGNGSRTAIELELTDKSEQRYREIVLRYRISQIYENIIYFVSRPEIERLMAKVILNRPIHANEKPETGKFYFVGLQRFLQNSMTTSISNGRVDFAVKVGEHEL